MALAAHVHVLGGFRLELEGAPHPVPTSARRLLALLAVAHRGERVARDTLAESMRPDSDPARAASTLRSVLWRLPRERGRALVQADVSEVRLHPEVRVDLWEAEALAQALCGLEAPRPEDLPALGLLGQDLLPGWSDEWLVVEQEAFRQRRLHALERGADVLRRAGRFHDALAAGLVAVRSEPLRESAHRRVIEVHLAEDNHAEALRHYDGYRRLLASELGLAPSESMRRLVAPCSGGRWTCPRAAVADPRRGRGHTGWTARGWVRGGMTPITTVQRLLTFPAHAVAAVAGTSAGLLATGVRRVSHLVGRTAGHVADTAAPSGPWPTEQAPRVEVPPAPAQTPRRGS